MGNPFITPVAKSVPFEPLRNPDFNGSAGTLTATNTQDAIEEAKASGIAASRGPTLCGFDGTANSGRWLEFYQNNPSNNNPFVVSEPAQIAAISISASANSTGTVTIYNNGLPVLTISLSAAQKARTKSLSIALTDLDTISAQVTSGSISRPIVFLFIRTL